MIPDPSERAQSGCQPRLAWRPLKRLWHGIICDDPRHPCCESERTQPELGGGGAAVPMVPPPLETVLVAIVGCCSCSRLHHGAGTSEILSRARLKRIQKLGLHQFRLRAVFVAAVYGRVSLMPPLSPHFNQSACASRLRFYSMPAHLWQVCPSTSASLSSPGLGLGLGSGSCTQVHA